MKNAFVIAPLLFTGSFTNFDNLFESFIAIIIFCLASSVTYIFNDYRDIDLDRNHPIKSLTRPLASDAVSIKQALVLGIILFLTMLALLVFNKSAELAIVIFGYLLLNFVYSVLLKNYAVIDIFCVSIGFVLRVYAGAVAISVPVSPWMFITTLAVALFIAASKRKHELHHLGEATGLTRNVLKSYSVNLIDRFVIAAAVLTLVFYSLFVVTSKESLILTVPLVMYGLFRYWYVCDHLGKGESPAEAIFTDKQLLICSFVWTILSGWLVWQAA